MDKAELRRSMRAARKAAALRSPDAGEALAARLLPLLDRQAPSRIIAGHVRAGNEIDPLPLLLALAARGVVLALPRLAAVAQPIAFHRWRPGDPLSPGAHRIPEPDAGAERLRPDILLVPGLAFDGEGRRLGQGGGHYDRTLAALRAAGPVLAIGLFYEAQRCHRLPEEPHDQRLDLVATPEALYDPDGSALARLEGL